MARYRIRLGYPRGRIHNEVVWAENAKVVDGVLKLVNADGGTVAIYRPGYWTIVRRMGD